MQSSVASKAYGTVSADRQKKMSGLEFVRGLVKLVRIWQLIYRQARQ